MDLFLTSPVGRLRQEAGVILLCYFFSETIKQNIMNKRLFELKAKADYLFYIDLIGERLYELRKDRNESLETVGKEVGMPPRTIRKMEKGLLNFRPSRLLRLCNYYGVSLSYIYRHNEYIVGK